MINMYYFFDENWQNKIKRERCTLRTRARTRVSTYAHDFRCHAHCYLLRVAQIRESRRRWLAERKVGHIGSVNKRIRIPKDGRYICIAKEAMEGNGRRTGKVEWGWPTDKHYMRWSWAHMHDSRFVSWNQKRSVTDQTDVFWKKQLRFCDQGDRDARFIYNWSSSGATAASWENKKSCSRVTDESNRWQFLHWHFRLNVDS